MYFLKKITIIIRIKNAKAAPLNPKILLPLISDRYQANDNPKNNKTNKNNIKTIIKTINNVKILETTNAN